ncbi:ABC transporter ATP-binding protein [candidate division KSB1 bacterium]|nr:MAG: ABC transporter ATP-binding protein [candidate division KSB1 bacterium]
MSNNVLIIQNLTKKFGDFTAVDNISLTVKKGEVFGFLGANGAGKTTTIRMICALLEPTAGEIELDGLSVLHQPEAVKRRIGYMSQKFSLYQDLTPFENMEFFAEIYNVSPEKLTEEKEKLAVELKLNNLNRILTKELPLGYKQRLALRTTLIHDPPILLLDEATSGVDPIWRRQFWDQIYELSAAGKTIFVTTHYMDEAEYCHRLSIMDKGKIVQTGTPAELKDKFNISSMQEVFLRAIQY